MLIERYIVTNASAINPTLYTEKLQTMYGVSSRLTVIWDTKKNTIVAATDHFDEISSLERMCYKMNSEYEEELVYLDMINKYAHG